MSCTWCPGGCMADTITVDCGASSPATRETGPKWPESSRTWSPCVRGEVYALRAPRGARGHEQAGARFAVVVQSDLLALST